VGLGPAGHVASLLLQLLADEPELMERLGEVPVAVVEKGKVCGAHNLSGAMMRPSGLQELFPDLEPTDWPTYGQVDKDSVYWMLSPNRALPLKPTPPPFRNHGNYVVSIAELSRWLAEKAEEAGAYILTETAAQQLLVEDGAVRGIRSGDKGRGKDGNPLGNFEPGADVTAQATVLAEGTWGHLTGAAIREFDLAATASRRSGRSASRRLEGPAADRVIHTRAGRCARGQVQGVRRLVDLPDGRRPTCLDRVRGRPRLRRRDGVRARPAAAVQDPLVRGILEGGERVAWGAKAIPGALLGDAQSAAGRLSRRRRRHGQRWCSRASTTPSRPASSPPSRSTSSSSAAGRSFESYEKVVEDSFIGKDLWEQRNTRQPFQKGLIRGGPIVNLMIATKGRFPGGRWVLHRNDAKPMFIGKASKSYPKPDGKYTFDKLSSVFITGNATRDDAPNHIRLQKRVPREIAETWRWMCPAGVYEIPEEAPEKGEVDVIVNYTNCVQCGAITAKGGRLTTPEGGDGPLYQVT
jgi:electron-transferring-flavoprotein dehydrogenase